MVRTFAHGCDGLSDRSFAGKGSARPSMSYAVLKRYTAIFIRNEIMYCTILYS